MDLLSQSASSSPYPGRTPDFLQKNTVIGLLEVSNWLNALPGPLLNQPTPQGLCGNWRHPSAWAVLGECIHAGVVEQGRSCRHRGALRPLTKSSTAQYSQTCEGSFADGFSDSGLSLFPRSRPGRTSPIATLSFMDIGVKLPAGQNRRVSLVGEIDEDFGLVGNRRRGHHSAP